MGFSAEGGRREHVMKKRWLMVTQSCFFIFIVFNKVVKTYPDIFRNHFPNVHSTQS